MYGAAPLVHLRTPARLPMTALDTAIPFWPQSGLVYSAMFAFLLGAYVALPDYTRVTRFLHACLFCQIVAVLCFILWPTVYPRELFPLPSGTGALGTALVAFYRSMDTPANCLPSLHVSTVVVCVGALRGSRLFVPGLVLSVPLILSTLTFKQHYVADVGTGLALGLLAVAIYLRKLA
jgi:hypothetical protein